MATIKTARHKPQMATVRPHSMQPLSPDTGRRGTVIRFACMLRPLVTTYFNKIKWIVVPSLWYFAGMLVRFPG